ncbi:hypothetical protein POSPLADRAFT_1043384 [Postia placenta MAD-698-R-SB12]|uniref:Uncharacterized protein n=1 Tax=Postia placenta MAD-698-R-SB12 TaxID=670580 RepID=A0A1X6NB43_9APHY|nr:hypothetical protein POSPLADRAFT_1043384 [Postia placenta MAD-698-R-SB12]OSX65794.1 hypothetical protein POSPLADRAFT_1043384 [Postia placenta MAD-698-R-SB12]
MPAWWTVMGPSQNLIGAQDRQKTYARSFGLCIALLPHEGGLGLNRLALAGVEPLDDDGELAEEDGVEEDVGTHYVTDADAGAEEVERGGGTRWWRGEGTGPDGKRMPYARHHPNLATVEYARPMGASSLYGRIFSDPPGSQLDWDGLRHRLSLVVGHAWQGRKTKIGISPAIGASTWPVRRPSSVLCLPNCSCRLSLPELDLTGLCVGTCPDHHPMPFRPLGMRRWAAHNEARKVRVVMSAPLGLTVLREGDSAVDVMRRRFHMGKEERCRRTVGEEGASSGSEGAIAEGSPYSGILFGTLILATDDPVHGLSMASLHKKGGALACGLSARTGPLIRPAQIHHSCPVHSYTPTESFFECTASQGARKQGGPATQTDSVVSLLLVKSTNQLRCSLARTRAGGGARQGCRPFRSIRAGPFPPWLGRRLLAGLHGPFSERVHPLVAERCLAECRILGYGFASVTPMK